MQVKYRNFDFYRLLFFSLKFVGIVFVSSHNLAVASSLYDSIISSHVIAESSIILAMSQDSKHNLFHKHDVIYIHIDIYRYFSIDVNYIFIKYTFIFV